MQRKRHLNSATTRGVALISVLLIVAILLAVVSRLMSAHNLVINQNQNTYAADQALQYALGAETLASEALFMDFESTGDIDHFEEIWAQQILPFELDEGGYLEAQVRDLQGCFNANSAIEEAGLDRFKRLLRNLALPEQIAEAWKDWIDNDEEITGFGAEDSEYLIATIPHRTPNAPVFDLSEMALLQGMEREQLEVLLPQLCLLPDSQTRLNVNTANLQALAALDDSLTPAMIEPIVSAPRQFKDVPEFVSIYNDFAPFEGALGVTSEYFQLHAIAQVGDSSVTLLSVLHRDTSTGEVTVLSRDFGKLFRSNVEFETEES